MHTARCTVHHAPLWKPVLSLLAAALCVAVGASRVYLGEHTPAQVIVDLPDRQIDDRAA